MKILAIDTSSSVLSLGITDGDVVIGEFMQNKALTHSERLMPHIRYLLQGVEEKIADMDLFAVTVGPGSFTGIRIGVATANAFAQATGKNVVGISTLEALAYSFCQQEGIIITTMYAQRDDYYRGIYRFEGHDRKLVVVKEEAAISRDEILKEAQELSESHPVVIAGELTIKLKEINSWQNSISSKKYLIKLADGVDNYIRGAHLCKIASQRQDGTGTYATPVYIRKPQAEVQYEEKIQQQNLQKHQEANHGA